MIRLYSCISDHVQKVPATLCSSDSNGHFVEVGCPL